MLNIKMCKYCVSSKKNPRNFQHVRFKLRDIYHLIAHSANIQAVPKMLTPFGSNNFNLSKYIIVHVTFYTV